MEGKDKAVWTGDLGINMLQTTDIGKCANAGRRDIRPLLSPESPDESGMSLEARDPCEVIVHTLSRCVGVKDRSSAVTRVVPFLCAYVWPSK